MKRNILYIIIPIIFISTFLVNCSGSAPTIDDKTEDKKPVLSEEQNKKKALEFFINGGVFETQGNYEAAVGQYEKALIYDSSAGLYYTLAKNYVYLNKLSAALEYSQNQYGLIRQRLNIMTCLQISIAMENKMNQQF